MENPTHFSTIYKKNGTFDAQRKSLLEDFKKSETHNQLLDQLKALVEEKVKNDPEILLKNKGKVAALIQGEIISKRATILSGMDEQIRELVNKAEFREDLRNELKNIRRKELGITEEEILEEEKREEERRERERKDRERREENRRRREEDRRKEEERRRKDEERRRDEEREKARKELRPEKRNDQGIQRPRFNLKKPEEKKKMNFMMY